MQKSANAPSCLVGTKISFLSGRWGASKDISEHVCRPFLRSLIYAANCEATNIKPAGRIVFVPSFPMVRLMAGTVLQSERSGDGTESSNVNLRKLSNLDAGPDGSPFLRDDDRRRTGIVFGSLGYCEESLTASILSKICGHAVRKSKRRENVHRNDTKLQYMSYVPAT